MTIYITGTSAISGAGDDLSAHWASLCEGKTAVKLNGDTYSSELTQVMLDKISKLKEDKFKKYFDSNTLLALLAARDCAKDANSPYLNEMAVIIGSSRGPLKTLEEEIIALNSEDQELVRWKTPQSILGVTAASIAADLKTSGTNMTVSTSCTSGLHAFGVGYMMLQTDQANSVMIGGVETTHPLMTEQFKGLKAYNTEGEFPYPYRPMHSEKKGTTFGTGASMIILEKDPKSKPVAKVLAYSSASESTTPTGLDPEVPALKKVVQDVIKKSNLAISDIDLIIGHGSGTKMGDALELKGYQDIFQDSLPPLQFNKWLMGHLIGASTPVSLALAIKHMESDFIPRHPYFEDNHFLGKSHNNKIKNVLVTGLGFGGSAGAIILQKCS